tara:strand:- start:446 stop:697 length:252 start_codon:yes stop_codon:yes gene_type:complete
MRIPDYQNVHGVKDIIYWATKTSKVNKAHEDEFENELEDYINERKPKAKTKKSTQKEHQNLSDASQELSEEQERNNDHLSNWA